MEWRKQRECNDDTTISGGKGEDDESRPVDSTFKELMKKKRGNKLKIKIHCKPQGKREQRPKNQETNHPDVSCADSTANYNTMPRREMLISD